MLAVELHCHSRRSHDGRDPLEALIEQAAERDLDAIAITDHDTIETSLRAVELAPSSTSSPSPGSKFRKPRERPAAARGRS